MDREMDQVNLYIEQHIYKQDLGDENYNVCDIPKVVLFVSGLVFLCIQLTH